MYTYIKEIGSQFLNRKSVIVDSKSSFNYVKESTNYEVSLSSSLELNPTYFDGFEKRLNDDLYISQIGTKSINNIKQTITMPSEAGNIDVTWEKYPNRSSKKTWDNISAIITNHKKINYDTITYFGDPDATTNKYFGGVLLPDRRVLAVPYNAEQIAIIDTDARTVIKIGTPDSALGKFAGGVLLPNNTIALARYLTTENNFHIIDPSDMSVEVISGLRGDANKFNGAVLNSDGGIQFISNGYYVQSQRYDFITKSLLNDVTLNASGFCGGIVLDDSPGIIVVPHAASHPAYYSFKNWPPYQSKTIGSSIQNIAKKFAGGVSLGNNRGLFIPHAASNFAIVDVNSMTSAIIGDADPTPDKYFGGVLLPDNRVLAVPYNSPQIAIFDPLNGQIEKIGLPDETAGKFIGGTLLDNGRVLLYPHNANQFAIVSASDGDYGPVIDLEGCLSGYLNKF